MRATELAVYYRPEVVLMEVDLPSRDGIDACLAITTKAPEVRVVFFSVYQEPGIEIRALRAGDGFLSKNTEIDAMVRALRSVCGRRDGDHTRACEPAR